MIRNVPIRQYELSKKKRIIREMLDIDPHINTVELLQYPISELKLILGRLREMDGD